MQVRASFEICTDLHSLASRLDGPLDNEKPVRGRPGQVLYAKSHQKSHV